MLEAGITKDHLAEANQRLRAMGCKVTLLQKRSGLYLRGSLADCFGETDQRMLTLQCKATRRGLHDAEDRAIEFWKAYQRQGWIPDPLPWAVEFKKRSTEAPVITCRQGIQKLHGDFWDGKDENRSQSHTTWQRIQADLDALPPGAELTPALLAAVIEKESAPNSRKRLGMVSNFKRLAKVMKIHDLEPLERLQEKTNYKAKVRDLSNLDDDTLQGMITKLRDHAKYGWALAALATYGCRPSEVWTLQPAADGTGRCLSIKEANALPEWRSVLAMPQEWIEQFDLLNVQRPVTYNTPEAYDSTEAVNLSKAMGKWLKYNFPGRQLYDLRHRWAHRQILSGEVGDVLGANLMGHSIALHQSTYFQAMQQRDATAIALRIRESTKANATHH